MAQPRARLGDLSDHGGHIITSASHTLVDGRLVARLGDLHQCPIRGHGITPIVTASGSVSAEGQPVARVGDKAACGATIIEGSGGVSAG